MAPIATVRGPSGESLRVASIHFITTPPPWRILTTGNTARLRQALALEGALEAMERSRGAEVATVVGGDTNASSLRETALRRLRDLFPDSPGPLPRGTRGPFPTDHLFFRSGASDVRVVEGSYRRITDTYYSDHNPVIALVRFGARAVSLDP